MSHTTALAYCQDKCSAPHTALHHATVFLPAADRLFWLGLFTLHHELRSACLKQLDEGLTRVKLGWWNNALRGTLDSGNTHPVLQALGPSFLAGLGAEFWANTIEGVAQRCEATRHNSMADWEASLKRELAPWIHLSAVRHSLSHTESAALLNFWVHSSKLAPILALPKHLDGHFQPIPIEVLEQHNVSAQDLRERKHNAQTQAIFASLCMQIISDGKEAWKQCSPATRRVGRPLQALFKIKAYEAKQHQKQWQLLSLQHRLSPMRKFGLAWLCYALPA